MSIYGRASTVTDPRETLVGGVGDTEGSGAGTSGQGGDRLGMTGQGKVGAGESGPGVGAEGAIQEGRDAESSRSKVGGDKGVFKVDGSGLAVEVGRVISCTMST